MNKIIFYTCLLTAFLFSVNAQEIKTEVFRTNTVLNIPAGQKIECFSAEGKYTYDSYDGGYGIRLFRGPRVKIAKDSSEFVYAVAPIGFDAYQGALIGINLIWGSVSLISSPSWVYSGDSSSLTLEGPVSINYQNTGSNGEPFLFSYKIFNTTSNNTISATSVVIPSSATGDVDVKLEQSADNVTWTECLPGTYNSSTVKRFFRLRAVEK